MGAYCGEAKSLRWPPRPGEADSALQRFSKTLFPFPGERIQEEFGTTGVSLHIEHLDK